MVALSAYFSCVCKQLLCLKDSVCKKPLHHQGKYFHPSARKSICVEKVGFSEEKFLSVKAFMHKSFELKILRAKVFVCKSIVCV